MKKLFKNELGVTLDFFSIVFIKFKKVSFLFLSQYLLTKFKPIFCFLPKTNLYHNVFNEFFIT